MIEERYDDATVFHKYFQITDNLMLENLSSGISFSKIKSPVHPSRILEVEEYQKIAWNLIDPDVRFLVKHHEIANNLTNVAEEIVEPLFKEFGEEIIMKQAYRNIIDAIPQIHLNKKPKFLFAESIDITFNTISSNIYPIASEVAKILKGNFDSMGLIFHNTSWLHITNIGPHNDIGQQENRGDLYTWDMVNHIAEEGFTPLRGLEIHNQRTFLNFDRRGQQKQFIGESEIVEQKVTSLDNIQTMLDIGDTVIDRS